MALNTLYEPLNAILVYFIKIGRHISNHRQQNTLLPPTLRQERAGVCFTMTLSVFVYY